jgi:predicted transcriptional regulator YheO
VCYFERFWELGCVEGRMRYIKESHQETEAVVCSNLTSDLEISKPKTLRNLAFLEKIQSEE